MKIVSSGKVLNSPEFYRKKKRRRRLQLIALSVGVLVSISFLIYVSRQEKFLISEVTVLGEDVVSKDPMIQVVKKSLAGYYLSIVPKASTLVYPRRAIEENLIENFPRLKSVDLNLGVGGELFISVLERVPDALYCPSVTISQGTSGCFFVDEEGLVFALAPSFSRGVYFIYASVEPIENPIGKRFLTTEEFKSLKKFIETLATLNVYPMALEVAREEYRLLLPNGGKIIWRSESDLAIIRSNLEAFLSSDAIQSQSNFFDKILSIDLRTENKVFYKFK